MSTDNKKRERPILLNAEMVRAVLDGRKTQTRRIMKVQPVSPELELSRIIESTRRIEDGKFFWREPGSFVNNRLSVLFSCPFGAVGDRLWVRECWSTHACFDDYKPSTLSPLLSLHYWADGKLDTGKKRPSLHMPRWASRITLEITNIGVQRLQSISQNDSAREGMIKLPVTGRYCLREGDQYFGGSSHDAREVFSWLWESIYGEESWQANPWVWVIEFKRVEEGV